MPKNNAIDIIIDTNLWIHFLISGRLEKLDRLIADGRVRILFSIELLDEISAATAKPKLKKYFGPKAVDQMLLSFDNYIDFVEVKSTVTLCRDVKDNFLLALATDGKADFLLTGDKDLLEIEKFGTARILSMTQFLSEIE